MDPTYSAEAEEYREKIRAFLGEHLPSHFEGLGHLEPGERTTFVEDWRRILADNRMLAVAWPEEFGGAGLTPLEQVVVHEEFAKAGVPTGGANDGFGIGMVGPTIIQWGTPEQKAHFLPRIISGEDLWCQGYSEPDAGSDLANLGTSAVLDGDEWVINGQKVWTSQAQTANWVFVLCRTDTGAAKHAGISFLLCPMDQPGIEIRPIINIARRHDFNEVFFSDARTAKANVIGEVNQGWTVANTLLGFERGGRSTVLGIGYRDELDRLTTAAQDLGRSHEPTIRQRLAWCHERVEILGYLGKKALTAGLGDGAGAPPPSLMKLFHSEYHKKLTELALDIIGPDAMAPTGRDAMGGIGLDAMGAPYSSNAWVGLFYGARPGSIYAGTSEVQRNIIGERVLGLPKEPRADSGPWSERVKS